MSNDWFIRINNAEHGPLSPDKLKQLAQQGKVTSATPVKQGAAGNWVAAGRVKGLLPIAAGHSESATAVPSTRPNLPVAMPTAKPGHTVPDASPQNAPPPLPPQQAAESPVAFLESIDLQEAQKNAHAGPSAPALSTRSPTSAHRRPTRSSRKANGSGVSLGCFAVVGIVLGAAAVGATLWATGFLSRFTSKYGNLSPSTKALVISLKRLKVKTETGVNYDTYSSSWSEIYPDVKLFLESAEAKDLPELAFVLTNACECYGKVNRVWNASIYGNALEKDEAEFLMSWHIQSKLWAVAGLNLGAADDLITGSSGACNDVQQRIHDKNESKKFTMEYTLAPGEELCRKYRKTMWGS